MSSFSDFFLKTEVIWFLIGLFFIILEFGVPGLIVIFLGIGAWVTALFCLLFNIPINLQLIIFIASSILSILLLRKYFKNIFLPEGKNTDDLLEDEFLGKTATVEVGIKNGRQGKVSFKGTTWNAVSNQNIDAGKLVKVVGKDSIVLKVEPLEN